MLYLVCVYVSLMCLCCGFDWVYVVIVLCVMVVGFMVSNLMQGGWFWYMWGLMVMGLVWGYVIRVWLGFLV